MRIMILLHLLDCDACVLNNGQVRQVCQGNVDLFLRSVVAVAVVFVVTVVVVVVAAVAVVAASEAAMRAFDFLADPYVLAYLIDKLEKNK